MLNSTTLSNELKEMFDDVLPDAIETALNSLMPIKSKSAEKKNKEFADLLTEMVSKPLSQRMAASIASGNMSSNISFNSFDKVVEFNIICFYIILT